MITILGAGGAIGNELVKLLAAKNEPFRLVCRNPKATPGATETFAADLTDRDQTVRAVAGSSVVHLLVGLKYDRRVWQDVWPRIMSNTIEACKRAGAKLIFFDNVYMYGTVSGPMTEETPFNPCSKKGEIRAKIATMLINEWKSGALAAMIARSADFYGPDTQNAIPTLLVFQPFARKRKASWLVNDAVPHSFTYTTDAAQSLVQLADVILGQTHIAEGLEHEVHRFSVSGHFLFVARLERPNRDFGQQRLHLRVCELRPFDARA